jgi:transcriptional regulator with XRE-family HTH domain
MVEISSNRLAEARKAKGVTQQELADRLGVHFVTISKLERGKMKLTADWIEKLAGALEVPPYEIFSPPMWRERVVMDGYLKGGLVFHPVRGASARYWIDIDDADDEASFWVGLADNALAPFYFQGDVLRFTGYREESFSMMKGRLGCMTLDDGRTVLAVVDTYHGDSCFDLRSTTGQIFERVKVEQFTVLTGAKIREPSLIQKKLAE